MSDQTGRPGRPPLRPLTQAVLLMLAAIVILPCLNTTAKLLAEDYSTTQIVWARYAGHLAFALIVFLPGHGLTLLRARRPGVHLVRSALIFVSSCFFFFALRYIQVPTATAVAFTAPIIVTALAVPFLGEKVGVRRWIAVLIGFGGALVIIRPGAGEVHWATLSALASAFVYAVYQVLTRKYATSDSAATSITYIGVVGTIVPLLLLPFEFLWPKTILDFALFCLLGMFGGFGHFLVIKAFRLGEASLLAPFIYGDLVMATLLGYLLFGTLPDSMTWLGAAIIVSSGLYITYRETKRKQAAH